MSRINKRQTDKLAILLKQKNKLFHTNDLALLWGTLDKDTLYTTIKRYIKKGIFFRIQKGFYSIVANEDINPVELGIKALHQYAYLSCESILAQHGLISQNIPYFTLVSSCSKHFSLLGHDFRVRKMKDKFLYQTIGIIKENGYNKANLERAVADLLYFNPHYYIDQKKLINWKLVKQIQKEIGFI